MALPSTDLIAPTQFINYPAPSSKSPSPLLPRDDEKSLPPSLDISIPTLPKDCDIATVPTSLSFQEDGLPQPILQLTQTRKYVLLAVFSCSQFLDIVSVSGALVALADIESALHMDTATGTWIINAYSIAFAGCLLLAGRVSDLYSPKIVFISGFVVLGVFAIACGVSTQPIMLLVFRGLQGAGGAFTIPSALNMIINIFPDKDEQASALAIFSSSGALGSVLGLILAGVLLLYNWNIVFWIIGVIALPLSIACIFLLPAAPKKVTRGKLDLLGLVLLSGGLICLIYSLTTGSTLNRWAVPGVLVPMLLSIFILLPAFFFWETKVTARDALIPPATWRLPNFAVLFAVAMAVYGWFQSFFVPFSVLWQVEYGLSSLQTSLRFLPCGIVGGCITVHAAICPSHYRPKYLLAPAMFLCALGSLLFAFADAEDKYFKFALPGMAIGTVGGACAYVCCNIAILQSGDKEFAGTLGAIFNSALQVGTANLVSIITALSSTVAARSPIGSYIPYRDSHFFMVALMTIEGVAFLIFYREPRERRAVAIGH